MAPEESKSSLLLRNFPFLANVLEMSAGDILAISALAVALYLGGVSSYILGVTLSLPWPITTLINSYTLVHLTGQLTFMLLVAVTLFKVSKILSNGVLFQWNFMICKFYLGPKRPRGIRSPAVVRINKRLNNSVAEGRSYKRFQIIARALSVVILLSFIFFQN